MAEKLTPLDKNHIDLLSKVPDEDAYWTKDIAADANLRPVSVCTIRLSRLLKRGLVEKVVYGGPSQPSSWKRTEAGRAALALSKKDETP